MPILERDPWRHQYFSGLACPEHVVISTDDRDSFELYPEFAWVYDKTKLCATQNIRHAPFPIRPTHYPVFSKPITNLRGMGIESYILNNDKDYETHCKPGHFWMDYLEGDHVSTDVALYQGRIVWQAHVRGVSAGEGTFDYWHILPEDNPRLEHVCHTWLEQHMSGYTGMVNLESIGNRLIEVHLRMIDQWPDLYGKGWLESVIELYDHGIWRHRPRPAKEAFSVVLFGPEGLYPHPQQKLLDRLLTRTPSLTSLQIPFHASRPPGDHAMPPGGFRLAIVNCYELKAGRQACAELADFFGVRYDL